MENLTRLVVLAVLAPVWVPIARALWIEMRESLDRAHALEQSVPRPSKPRPGRTPPVVAADDAPRIRKLPTRRGFRKAA